MVSPTAKMMGYVTAASEQLSHFKLGGEQHFIPAIHTAAPIFCPCHGVWSMGWFQLSKVVMNPPLTRGKSAQPLAATTYPRLQPAKGSHRAPRLQSFQHLDCTWNSMGMESSSSSSSSSSPFAGCCVPWQTAIIHPSRNPLPRGPHHRQILQILHLRQVLVPQKDPVLRFIIEQIPGSLVCICKCKCKCKCICICICICIYNYIFMYVYVYIYIHICICVCVYGYVCITFLIALCDMSLHPEGAHGFRTGESLQFVFPRCP